MGYLEEQYVKGWSAKGGSVPGPTAQLLEIAQLIFSAKDFTSSACMGIAETAEGACLLATSGKPTDADKRLMGYVTKSVLPKWISVEDSPGYRSVHPIFFERARELGGVKQEVRGISIGAIGTGLCAENKILTYYLINSAAIRSLAVFSGADCKFASYQTTMSGGINYLYPRESCRSYYCEYLDMKLSGDTGYPMSSSTGDPNGLPSIGEMLRR